MRLFAVTGRRPLFKRFQRNFSSYNRFVRNDAITLRIANGGSVSGEMVVRRSLVTYNIYSAVDADD